MVEYKLKTHTNHLNDSTSFLSYGIVAFENNRPLHTISDVSTDKNAVEKLIQSFNTHSLAVCHLEQAIEDYLYDLSLG